MISPFLFAPFYNLINFVRQTMNLNEIKAALKVIAEEKNLTVESVIETVEAALAAAYRKDFGEPNQNHRASFDPDSGQLQIFDVKTVVEDVDLEKEQKDWEAYRAKLADLGFAVQVEAPVTPGERATVAAAPQGLTPTPENLAQFNLEPFKRFDPRKEIMLSEAKKINPKVELGEEIKTLLELPGDFGRMAAQTAKQVIMQRLREAERDNIYKEFKAKEGTIVVGIVQRREGRMVLVDLGRATAILPPDEQMERENYVPGSRIKAYVVSVSIGPRGTDIVLSRAHQDLVRKLFVAEVPEVAIGTVEIKAIAREAGSRTKVAVSTTHEHLDPVGSCVGQRGSRVQTIINELGGEKVDVVQYSDDSAKFISNALSPAKVTAVQIDEASRAATVKVREDQLSLAIGRGGQNVRLAAKLTGYKIDIVSESGQTVSSEDEVDEFGQPLKAGEENTVSEVSAVKEDVVVETPKVKDVVIADAEEKKVDEPHDEITVTETPEKTETPE